jgi:hypothetical protein
MIKFLNGGLIIQTSQNDFLLILYDILDALEDMVFPDLSFFEHDFSPPSASASGMVVIATVSNGIIINKTKNAILPFMMTLIQNEIKVFY